MKRIFLIVLDSVGAGALPDAAAYGDAGANTLGHIIERAHPHLPNMEAMGLGLIPGVGGPVPEGGAGVYGRAAEVSAGKDTTTGHWEIAGLRLDTPFPTYPNGFPPEVMDAFEKAIGTRTLGNYPASGTAILDELGEEHIRTGYPIVYTSADSVFQIAAHEQVIPLEELYRICETARAMLTGEYLVGRVIARPFIGGSGAYTRTENRRDYAMPPFSDTILDALDRAGLPVVGIGKIEDIFCHRGVTVVDHTRNNPAGIAATQRFLESGEGAFIFANLVDFDMLYGHRNDVEGYAAALEAFDAALPAMLGALREGDLLMVTADHGCDPTTPGTDHTREYIPLVAAGPRVRAGVNLGTRSTFADIGATVYEHLTGSAWRTGTSFLREIWRD